MIALSCCGGDVLGSGGDSPPPPVGVSITNVGGGGEVYRTTTGPNPFEMRTLISTNGSVSITQNTDTLDLEVELVNLDEPSDGCNIWDGNYGPIGLKAIYVPPTGALSLSCEATRIRIDYTGSFGNLGTGAQVYSTASTTASRRFRTLVGGTGINITQGTDEIEIESTVTAASASNVGGANEVYRTGTSGPFEFRTIAAGAGIGIVQGTNTLTISNTAAADTCANVGDPGGAEVYVTGSSMPFNFRKLSATGGGITITQFGDDIFLGVAVPSLTSAGGTTLVNDGTGPALAVKGLTAGTGVSLSASATEVTINNSSPASSVTLTSAGGTETLVNDGTGPTLANKGLTAGTGVSLSSDATSVTITNSSPASSVTLASAGGTETLVNDGTGPAIATKGLTAGAGISLSSSATAVTISATAAASPGMELIFNVNGATVAASTRRVTAPYRIEVELQVRVNVAAGTQVAKVQARCVSSGTLTLHNQQIMEQSTLGTNQDASTVTPFTTSSTTFVDVTSMTLTLPAGDHIVIFSADCTPP